MKFESVIFLDFEELNEIYFNLLINEDFDFKTKDINILISKKDLLEVKLSCNSVVEFKIANNALIKSLEIIDKTLKV